MRKRIFHPSVELEFLEAFCWDNYIGEFLILYHLIEKSFWGYKSVAILPYSDRLVKLGDKWTDVILNYPTNHFHRLAKIQRDRQRVIAEFKNI